MKKNSRPSTPEGTRIVLGIDPGTMATGFGIVARRGGRLRMLECGTITNRSTIPISQRLLKIHRGIAALVQKHRPDEIAIESAFYGKNAQSALKLGHARGVSILAAVQAGIPTAEYSPREVKLAVAGRGNASKEQVQFMVRALLGTPTDSMVLDASDALAIAICHIHRATRTKSNHKDWKSFVRSHPDRVRL
jgi:crossover junction endodeoxyribonuclease RuvC